MWNSSRTRKYRDVMSAAIAVGNRGVESPTPLNVQKVVIVMDDSKDCTELGKQSLLTTSIFRLRHYC